MTLVGPLLSLIGSKITALYFIHLFISSYFVLFFFSLPTAICLHLSLVISLAANSILHARSL